jgi:hypothetical protein
VLAVAGDDGDLLAVLAESVELVLEGSLDLLAGDVGELRFGDQRLGLGADELLLKNDDARRLRVLVLELSDLVGDLLLACSWGLVTGSKFEIEDGDLTVSAGLHGSLDVTDALNGDAVLVVAVDELVLQFTNLVDQDAELIRDV